MTNLQLQHKLKREERGGREKMTHHLQDMRSTKMYESQLMLYA